MKTPVVIRCLDIFGKWYICHANSYQSAFGCKVNGFCARGDAVEFAEKHDCEVVFHEHDSLQQFS